MSDDILNAELTTEIVAAYVGNNPVPREGLSDLIQSVHDSLNELAGADASQEAEPLEPAVPINKSVKKNYIICLECGEKFKSIKRHLGASHGLTPDAYREKWGLKADYPMVAPEYAARRSQLATEIGLGRKPKAAR